MDQDRYCSVADAGLTGLTRPASLDTELVTPDPEVFVVALGTIELANFVAGAARPTSPGTLGPFTRSLPSPALHAHRARAVPEDAGGGRHGARVRDWQAVQERGHRPDPQPRVHDHRDLPGGIQRRRDCGEQGWGRRGCRLEHRVIRVLAPSGPCRLRHRTLAPARPHPLTCSSTSTHA